MVKETLKVRNLSELAVDDILWISTNNDIEFANPEATVAEYTEGAVLGFGKSWVLFGSAEDIEFVIDSLDTLEDRRLSTALDGFSNFDPTPEQEAFVTRSVRRSFAVMEKKLRKGLSCKVI
tara:strand:+ start:7871 stop:8233 length:363 start_codon:yes stop_codon:yes gene_type:complete